MSISHIWKTGLECLKLRPYRVRQLVLSPFTYAKKDRHRQPMHCQLRAYSQLAQTQPYCFHQWTHLSPNILPYRTNLPRTLTKVRSQSWVSQCDMKPLVRNRLIDILPYLLYPFIYYTTYSEHSYSLLVLLNSNCAQTTCASDVPKLLSQTVPQALLIQISTLPSSEFVPLASLSVPSVQLPLGVVSSVWREGNYILH